jgi:nucleotide-binding universal stress UspA family protein
MIKISSPFRIVVPRIPGSPQRILIPILDIPSVERGIDLARRLRENLETEIRLLHVIEVPMTLPLEASLPQEETKAREILRRGESLANLWGSKFANEIKRGRLASEEIIRTAEDWGADMIVMSVQLRTQLWQKIFGRTSERVRGKGPWEVLLDEFSPGRLIKGKKAVGDKQILNSDFPSRWASVQIRV